MVNFKAGYKQIDDFVHYFVNGLPVYCHKKENKNGYCYVMATNNKFCSIKELSEALGVPGKNIEQYAKALREKGMTHFFNRQEGNTRVMPLDGRVEHLFGFVENSMHGSFVRTIAIARAKAKIGMIHPVG